MKWQFFISLLFITYSFGIVNAQDPVRIEIDLENFAESLFQLQDEDINYEDLYESLLLLYSNPINLNTASKSKLESIFILSIAQINSLIEYREKVGPLLSLYELQAIPNFDIQTIRNILPFIEIKSSSDFKATGTFIQRILNEKNNYLMLRTERILEKQKGFSVLPSDTINNRFLGSPYKIYGRFRVNHSKDFSLGITFEKDQGEQFTWNTSKKQYGFDYLSFHFMKENIGPFKKIVIGDYQMQFGQGLILGAGFNPGKGSETITTVKRSSSGLKPYSSVLETGFLRGAAFTFNYKNFEITSFYSRLIQDANILNDTTFTNFDEFISSIQQTGFHRTNTELKNKDAIIEQNIGGNVLYKNKHETLEFGVTFIHSNYSLPITKKPNNYNQFEFKGKHNFNIGANVNYNWENFLLFGEAAMSKSKGLGMVTGFIGSLNPIISVSMVLRNYQRNFHSFYGNSFGESSRNINERGVYWGLKITPSKKYFFTAYYDRFKFPWLRFRAESPSQGYEYLARFNYKPSRAILLYAQIRTEGKERTTNPDNGNLNRLELAIKRSYLVNIDYKIGRSLSLKSRVQFSNFTISNKKTKGFVIAQDLNFQISKFRFSTRIALFDTDDFENRQYLYEKDVLYAFSIPAFSNTGVRTYALIQYKPTRKLTFWIKYSQTRFDKTSTVLFAKSSSFGTALNQIKGNTKSAIRFQMRMKF